MVESNSEKMKSIGGYFELELRYGEHYHKNAIYLNTARNCLEYILIARHYSKVYIPYYTCDVILQPLLKHNIKYEFYFINEKLEPIAKPKLLFNEAFLYTNYFGLKQSCVEKLAAYYGSQLIVDNAQAFYAPRISSIDTFYSPRKFFGVTDGGYLYTDCIIEKSFVKDKSYDRMQHLLQRIDEGAEKGYFSFRKNECCLDNCTILKMSNLTQKILSNIDYEKVREKRLNNYHYLDNKLGSMNFFNSLILHSDDVPMVYPFYSLDNTLKGKLISNKIFVATYWPNVLQWCRKDSLEFKMANRMLAIPIDQRYNIDDMMTILSLINV